MSDQEYRQGLKKIGEQYNADIGTIQETAKEKRTTIGETGRQFRLGQQAIRDRETSVEHTKQGGRIDKIARQQEADTAVDKLGYDASWKELQAKLKDRRKEHALKVREFEARQDPESVDGQKAAAEIGK